MEHATEHFSDRLLDAVDRKQSRVVVGLDPRLDQIPAHIRKAHLDSLGPTVEAVEEIFLEFNKRIIDAVTDYAVAVKLQVAFYEKYGYHGIKAFEETTRYAARKGLIVIEDAKRNDIGPTAQAYADGHLGEVELPDGSRTPMFDVDAMTVNAYLGIDGVAPFIQTCKTHRKGIFILARTSNPSAGEFQNRPAKIEPWQAELIHSNLRGTGLRMADLTQDYAQTEAPNFVVMALLIHKWAQGLIGKKGYSSIGAVVGATYPREAKVLRSIMPNSIFLVPGYGAQGGTAKDVARCFKRDGYGAIVNSSRDIIFAYCKEPWRRKFDARNFAEAARVATDVMRNDINRALEKTR